MASPRSDADSAAARIAKDRNCPFCDQAFTSSSLGRHLDLYIKSKNPKPPDGVHHVDEIRKMRGNITRRQSRVASIKRDTSVPAGPASARYSFDDRIASTPDSMRRVNWTVNKPGWEATGVMNDLPPRLEPRPTERKDVPKRDQMKADLDQRQRLADELDTGRAAQLALKEILDTVRNAEASVTGQHLFDFDFFQQTFPSLCLRLLSPSASISSSLVISTGDCWSSKTPWEQERQALSRVVEERGQLLKRKDSLLSATYEDASASDLNLEKFHQHIGVVFDVWKNMPEHNRHDEWQRAILQSYARMDKELKEARTAIKALRRDAEFVARRLDRGASVLSPNPADRHPSMSVLASPTSLSDDVLEDLTRQGVRSREWDYERVLDKWKNVVRDERRAQHGLQAQRNFSASSRVANAPAHLSANGATTGNLSRSASVASALSGMPTRTSSVDSAADADAEGEEEDMEADNIAPDAHSYTRRMQEQHSMAQQPMVNHVPQMHIPHTSQGGPILDPRANAMPAHLDQNYKWPQAQHMTQAAAIPPYQALPEQATMRRMPPGPDSWHTEIHHAASHNMEGMEGPANAGASTST